MTVDRLDQVPARGRKGNASDHSDRIAQCGMLSRIRRLNASGDVELRLGCRSTVFVYGFYPAEYIGRHVLVGLRSKTSLGSNGGWSATIWERFPPQALADTR